MLPTKVQIGQSSFVNQVQKRSIGEMLLEKSSSPYLNDTMTEIVIAAYGFDVESAEIFLNTDHIDIDLEDRFFYLYAAMCLETDKFEDLLFNRTDQDMGNLDNANSSNNLGLQRFYLKIKELLEQKKIDAQDIGLLELLNKKMFSNEIQWLKETEPFFRMQEKEIRRINCNHPEDDQSFLQLCKEVQNIIKLSLLEKMLEYDPKLVYLDKMVYPEGFNVSGKIKELAQEIDNHYKNNSFSNGR